MPIGKGGEHLPYKGEPGYKEAKAANPAAYANKGESKVADRFAGVQSQEMEDTGRPREVSLDERKRAGAEVTRAARESGVGGKFTAPAGLDQEGLNRWQDAAIADMRKRNRSADDVLDEKRRAATTVPKGY